MGLPTEGTNAQRARAGAIARTDVPTCALDERVGAVRDQVRALGWDACVAVNDDRIVLGLLRAKELEADPDRRIEQAMRPGPSTFRPHILIEHMASFFTDHDITSVLITTSEGRLIGLLRGDDVAEAARREHEGRSDG